MPRTAVRFRQQDRGPAELGHLRPELARETERVAIVAIVANPTHRRLVLDEVGGGLLEELLVFGE
jgi:hypothetical protein